MEKLNKLINRFEYWFYRAIVPIVLCITLFHDIFTGDTTTYIFSMITAICISKLMWYVIKENQDDTDTEGIE